MVRNDQLGESDWILLPVGSEKTVRSRKAYVHLGGLVNRWSIWIWYLGEMLISSWKWTRHPEKECSNKLYLMHWKPEGTFSWSCSNFYAPLKLHSSSKEIHKSTCHCTKSTIQEIWRNTDARYYYPPLFQTFQMSLDEARIKQRNEKGMPRFYKAVISKRGPKENPLW